MLSYEQEVREMISNDDCYHGFRVGERVRSGDSLGTVVKLSHELSEEDEEVFYGRRCVPVMFDKDISTGMRGWILAANLVKVTTP
jgi:hypothetical protein